MRLYRLEPADRLRSQARGQPVDQSPQIFGGRWGGLKSPLAGGQAVGDRHRQTQLIESEPRIQGPRQTGQPFAEQAQHGRRLAGGTARAHGDMAHLPVQAEEAGLEGPAALSAKVQPVHGFDQQVADHRLDIDGLRDRLDQNSVDGNQRDGSFGTDADVLASQHPIQPRRRRRAEAGGDGGGRAIRQMPQGLQARPRQGLGLLVRQLQRRDRQAAQGLVLPPPLVNPAPPEARQGARRLGRAGQGQTHRQTHALGPRRDSPDQPRLAPEQMGATGHVQRQTVRPVGRRHRRETPEVQQHPFQQGRVRLRPVRDHANIRRPRPCIGQGHARRQTQGQGRAVGRRQAQRPLHLLHEHGRSLSRGV